MLISLLLSQVNAATCSDLELDKEIVFGLFNGVQTTPGEAANALDLIQTSFLNTYVSTKGEKIEYTLFYNKTEGLSDFAETFDQRAKEHSEILANKLENFWRIKNEDTSVLNKIEKMIPAMADVKKAEHNAELAQILKSLTNLVGRSKTTNIMYADHKEKINCIEGANKKFLIFAHSQGNLFATQAYDYVVKTKKVPQEAIKLIHIAPASPTLRGQYSHFLEDLDLVINGLRLTGEVPPITHYMSNPFNRPAGLNNDTDFLGHGLLEIYLNPHLDVSVDIYGVTGNALDTLEFPKKIDPTPPDGVDPDTFDYQAQCSNIQFPQNVQDYDEVIKAVIKLYSHESKDTICRKIEENLNDMGVDTSSGGGSNEGTEDSSGTDNNDTSGGDTGTGSETGTFDYKTKCQGFKLPDPIPSELETSINGIIENAGSSIVADVVCPLIDAAVQAYKLQNGGGVPGGSGVPSIP